MPLFKKGGASFADARKSEGFEEKKGRNARTDGANSTGPKNLPEPSNVPPRSSHPEKPNSAARPQPERPAKPATAPETPTRFVFYAQLAHGSPTGKVEGFTNVRELYQKIAKTFQVQASEVGEHLESLSFMRACCYANHVLCILGQVIPLSRSA